MIRGLLYWFVWTVVAICATGVTVYGYDGQTITGADSLNLGLLPVSDPGRAVLLGVGIMAMAFTYRQAWNNWRRK